MDTHLNAVREQQKSNRNYLFILCIAGLAINYLLAHLAIWLHLPLYLDNIGSALAAALGGFLPGIIVGFFTNNAVRVTCTDFRRKLLFVPILKRKFPLQFENLWQVIFGHLAQ